MLLRLSRTLLWEYERISGAVRLKIYETLRIQRAGCTRKYATRHVESDKRIRRGWLAMCYMGCV